jgi:uncharacterized protein YjbI with pentapeptide repeats
MVPRGFSDGGRPESGLVVGLFVGSVRQGPPDGLRGAILGAEDVVADWERYLGVERRRAHDAWLGRGRTGDGRIDLDGRNLMAAGVRGAAFTAIRLARCALDGSAITFSELDEAELVDCSAARSAFLYSRFHEARVQGCSFVEADFGRASFWRATLSDTDFTAASLVESNFVKCELHRMLFQRADLRTTQLDGDRFVDCDFRDADLGDGKLHDSTFERCDLRGARLEGRRLKNTVFRDCQLDGVVGTPQVEGPCEGLPLTSLCEPTRRAPSRG